MHRRAVYFSLNEKEFLYDFGTYALILYYSMQINRSTTEKLFDATQSEFYYRIHHQLPEDNYTDENESAHFVVTDIVDIVQYIENELIPTLANETEDLITKYGGEENFCKLFNNDEYLPNRIGIDFGDDEFYCGECFDLISDLRKLTDIFQYSLLLNQPLNVYVW
jgi:hypothetical protein